MKDIYTAGAPKLKLVFGYAPWLILSSSRHCQLFSSKRSHDCAVCKVCAQDILSIFQQQVSPIKKRHRVNNKMSDFRECAQRWQKSDDK